MDGGNMDGGNMDGGNMDDGTDAGSCRRRSTRP